MTSQCFVWNICLTSWIWWAQDGLLHPGQLSRRILGLMMKDKSSSASRQLDLLQQPPIPLPLSSVASQNSHRCNPLARTCPLLRGTERSIRHLIIGFRSTILSSEVESVNGTLTAFKQCKLCAWRMLVEQL